MNSNAILKFLAFFVLVIGVACQPNNKVDYEANRAILTAHSWRFDVPDMIERLNKMEELTTREIIAHERAIERMTNIRFDFKQDSSLHFFNGADYEIVGEYRLSENVDELMLAVPGMVNKPHGVTELSANRIVLKADPTKGHIFTKVLVPMAE